MTQTIDWNLVSLSILVGIAVSPLCMALALFWIIALRETISRLFDRRRRRA